MPDEQTMKDHIEDLLIERARLYEELHVLTSLAQKHQSNELKWHGIAKAFYTSIVDPEDPVFGCQSCAIKAYEREING